MHGNAICKGMTYLYSPSNLNGCVIMDGDTANGNGDPQGGVVAGMASFGWQWGENHGHIRTRSPTMTTNIAA